MRDEAGLKAGLLRTGLRGKCCDILDAVQVIIKLRRLDVGFPIITTLLFIAIINVDPIIKFREG